MSKASLILNETSTKGSYQTEFPMPFHLFLLFLTFFRLEERTSFDGYKFDTARMYLYRPNSGALSRLQKKELGTANGITLLFVFSA